MKCPKTCLFFKLVKYTMIISSEPPFKEGHDRFPIVPLPCIPLSDCWFFLSCKCKPVMPLHKWKFAWNYVSSPFKTHYWVETPILKTFIHKFKKQFKPNIFILLHSHTHSLKRLAIQQQHTGWVKKRLTTQFFCMVRVLGRKYESRNAITTNKIFWCFHLETIICLNKV